MIGTSSGQFSTEAEWAASGGNIIPPITTEISPDKSKQPQPLTDPDMWKEPGAIDRDHHVPLLASAVLDKDNNMVGMAIDHRANMPDEYIPHLWGHEQRENEYMNDLLKTGYSPQDAYHKAHDWSTARESAGVEAEFGPKGLEDYKQHMRDQASIASEPSDRDRHPDAHTTRHGLDESELAMNFKPINPMQPSYTNPGGHEKLPDVRDPGRAAMQHPDVEMVPQKQQQQQVFAGHKANPSVDKFQLYSEGADKKLRIEIPDIDSKLTLDKSREAMKNKNHVLLPDILDHSELYKAYPSIQNVQISVDPSLKQDTAYFDRKLNLIALSQHHESEERMKETLLHEIQHWIQNREGFTFGASKANMQPYVLKAIENLGIKPSDVVDPVTQFQQSVTQAYRSVAGEVEARNVENRADMTHEELRANPPHTTEDIPRERQLNSPTGTRSESRPWTTKEIETIKKGEKPKGRSDKAIERARDRFGLSDKYKPLTAEEITTLKEAGPHLSIKELARMLNRTPDSVAQALQRLK